MTIAQVQKSPQASGTTVTTLTATLPVAATVGNLLLAFHTFESAAVTPTTPAGWSVGPAVLGGSAARTFSTFWKISTGGETGVTVTTGVTSANARLACIELSGTDPVAPVAFGLSASNSSIASSVTSWASGVSGATSRELMMFAYVGFNAGSGGTISFTNGYDATAGYSAADLCGLGVKHLPLGTAGESTTASWLTSRQAAMLLLPIFGITLPASSNPVVGRRIGGQSTWGSKGETWAVTDPTNPSGTTWAQPVGETDMEQRLYDDPTISMGVPIGPVVSGGLRLVVQLLNPTGAIDSTWGAGVWGTSHWSSSVGNWVDVSNRVRSVDWANGSSSPNQKSEVGNASLVLDNIDGLLSPWASSGPFVGLSSTSWVRTGLIVRWGVLKTGTLPTCAPQLDTYSGFLTGKVEEAVETNTSNVDSVVTLTIVETTVDLGSVAPVDMPLDDGRALTSVIFEALLAAGWPYQTSIDVPTEDVAVPATTLSGSSAGGSASARLVLLTDGMHWDFLADGRGRVIIVRRHLSTTPGSFVGFCSHTINFANNPGANDTPAGDITTYSNVERILNQATGGTVGTGALTTVEDTRSMGHFGTVAQGYGYPRTDLVLQTDADVAALGQRVISLRAWDDLGIATVSLDADMDPVNLPAIMTFVAARAREAISFGVTYTHPSGTVFNETVIVEGQSHTIAAVDGTIGAALKWTATLNVGHSGATSET